MEKSTGGAQKLRCDGGPINKVSPSELFDENPAVGIEHEISVLDDIDPKTHDDVVEEEEEDVFSTENENNCEKQIVVGDDEESDKDHVHDDESEMDLVPVPTKIYMAIAFSNDIDETVEKLMEIGVELGQEFEVCDILLECCIDEKIYQRHYDLLGQQVCMMNDAYRSGFEHCFHRTYYSTIHHPKKYDIRSDVCISAEFFGHLLSTDTLPWRVLSCIRLTEEETTSFSRIFIQVLFQSLCSCLGIQLLNERLTDPAMEDLFDESIFPKDNPRNTRFSIDFFTSIDLGGITDHMREFLDNMS